MFYIATDIVLNSCAREGRWMGFDETSNGHQIYWPGKQSVTIERSVSFVPNEVYLPSVGSEQLEGEWVQAESNQPAATEINDWVPETIEVDHQAPETETQGCHAVT